MTHEPMVEKLYVLVEQENTGIDGMATGKIIASVKAMNEYEAVHLLKRLSDIKGPPGGGSF